MYKVALMMSINYAFKCFSIEYVFILFSSIYCFALNPRHRLSAFQNDVMVENKWSYNKSI